MRQFPHPSSRVVDSAFLIGILWCLHEVQCATCLDNVIEHEYERDSWLIYLSLKILETLGRRRWGELIREVRLHWISKKRNWRQSEPRVRVWVQLEHVSTWMVPAWWDGEDCGRSCFAGKSGAPGSSQAEDFKTEVGKMSWTESCGIYWRRNNAGRELFV